MEGWEVDSHSVLSVWSQASLSLCPLPTVYPYRIWTFCMVAQGSPNCNIGSGQSFGLKPRSDTASLLLHLVNSNKLQGQPHSLQKGLPDGLNLVFMVPVGTIFGDQLLISSRATDDVPAKCHKKMAFIGNKLEQMLLVIILIFARPQQVMVMWYFQGYHILTLDSQCLQIFLCPQGSDRIGGTM